jgi:hypothetical protein
VLVFLTSHVSLPSGLKSGATSIIMCSR